MGTHLFGSPCMLD